MPWGAAIAAVGSVAGGLLSSSASKSAADTQSAAGRYAADLQHQQFEETNANLSPFRSAGQGAVNILSSLYGIPTVPLSVTTGGTPAAVSAGSYSNPLSAATPSQIASGSVANNAGLPPGYQIVQGQLSGGETQTGGGFQLVDASGNLVLSGPSVGDIYARLPTVGLAPNSGTAAPAPSTTATQTLPGGIPGAPTTFAYDPAAYGLGNGVFKPTEAELVQTPGYKFTLDQGLRAVQNSAAARGLGTSGAALKGAAQFATGLADQTLNTQANIYSNNVARTAGIFNSNLSNYLSPLEYLGTLGENAAATTGTIGAASAANQGNALIGAANASAAGTVGSATAISNGITGGINGGQNYLMYNRLLDSLDRRDGGGGDSSLGQYY